MVFYYLLIGVGLAVCAHVAFRWIEQQSDENKQIYKRWATRGGIAGVIWVLIRAGVLRLGAVFNILTLLLPFLLGAKTHRPDEASPNERARGTRSEPGKSSDMTRQEAAQILGVNPDAPKEEIEKAYRRLIARAHPDAGGSDFLAAQINRAREVLLKK